MNRQQLERVIVEVGERFGLNYFYVIGSAAVLATVPDLTDFDLVGTRDVDVIPNPPKPADVEWLADRIDFVLGEGSDFEREHGFYAQGLDMTSPAYAPPGWTERAVPVKVGQITAQCMEIHDLAVSKYGAARDQDLAFTAALARYRLIRKTTLLERLAMLDIPADRMAGMRARIDRDLR